MTVVEQSVLPGSAVLRPGRCKAHGRVSHNGTAFHETHESFQWINKLIRGLSPEGTP